MRKVGLLLGDGHGETTAALAATALQGETTATRPHPLAETMAALTALVVRLIGALHDSLLFPETRRFS